jgi:hypothetical protein
VLAFARVDVCLSSGNADEVVRESMCVSTSCTSNRTRDSGVERSSDVSLASFVERMSVFVKVGAWKSGDANAS